MINELIFFKNIIVSRITRQPYKLNFAVTSLCNSRCRTCNIWQIYKKNPKTLKNELKIEEINTIFKNLPRTISWLSLTGGEPFLRKDFEEIINSAIKNIPNLGLIGIPSNGLATERIVSVVKKMMRRKHPSTVITISIDGPEKIHDKIRGVKGGFKKAWKTYEELKRLTKKDGKLSIGIESTISKYNIRYIAPFLKEMVDKNNNITITMAHNASLYHNEKDASFLPEDIKEIEKTISIVLKNKSILNPQNLIERIFLKNILGYIKNPKRRVMPCFAFTSSFSLDQFGNVIPCLMWYQKTGNLRDFDYDAKKILHSRKAKEIREMIKNNKCPNCWTPCEGYQSTLGNLANFRLSVIKKC